MRKSRVLLSSWLAIGVLLAVGFNNCGKVAFEVSESVKAAALNELMSLSDIQIETAHLSPRSNRFLCKSILRAPCR
jgi:hypothetical protein